MGGRPYGDKIQEMLTKPPGPQAVAVLVNALYFKAVWKDVFEEEATKQADFYPTDGPAVQVMMMKRSGMFGYAAHEDWQAVKLPYGEGQMEMVVVLPGEQSSLAELVSHLEQGALLRNEDFSSSRGRCCCQGSRPAMGQSSPRRCRRWALCLPLIQNGGFLPYGGSGQPDLCGTGHPQNLY